MLHRDCPRQVALILAGLFADAEAELVLLIEPNGQVLAGQGYGLRPDLTRIAHLIGGTFKSLHETYRLRGETTPDVLFQQGTQEHLACAAIRGERILAATFTQAVPAAFIRQRMRQARDELNGAL
jgi:hypothetical protein